jgi:hypothetical protein
MNNELASEIDGRRTAATDGQSILVRTLNSEGEG